MFVWGCLGVGLVLMIVGTLWSWSKAAQDSPAAGRKYFLGWGSFQLLYIIKHWETMKTPTLPVARGSVDFWSRSHPRLEDGHLYRGVTG